MPRSIGFALLHSRYNNSSIATLCGAVERACPNLDILLVRKNQLNKLLSLKNKELILFGFSFTSAEIKEIPKFLHSVRATYSELPLFFVAGGSHASGDPYGTLKMGFDLVVRGEGEVVLIDLIKGLRNETILESLKGLCLFINGQFIQTPAQPAIDLNEYSSISRKWKIYNHLEITRGCPFQCSYCQTSSLFGLKPRHKSIETIMADVKFMKKYEKTDFRFITPNALGYGSPDGKKLALEAIESLLKSIRNEVQDKGRIFYGTFPSEVRPEFVNDDTIRTLKNYVNNDNIVIGAQSGSDRILKQIHRGHSLDSVYEAVESCKRFGFEPILDFILGFPAETREDRVESLRVFEDLIKNGARIHMHFFIPLPGTPLWDSEMPITFLSRDLERTLNTIASRGKLFGQWKQQEKIARRLLKYKQRIQRLKSI